MFEGKSYCPANTKHLYNIYTTAPNIFDIGPTLHKVVQVFCFYWVSIQVWVNPFRNPHSNTVSLFANQRPAKSQG